MKIRGIENDRPPMNTSTTRRRRNVTLTWLDLVHVGIFSMFLALAHFSLG